jgi:hypothetical protein
LALTDAYATAAEYRTITGTSGTTDNNSDANILRDLKAVSRLIERRTGRFFNMDAAALARIFYARESGPHLYVDDIASLTNFAIKVDTDGDGSFADETAFAAADYELRPLTAPLGPEPRPWTEIYLPSWTTQSYWNISDRIEVTAIWGWPAVPDAIKDAAVQLTAILRLQSPRATNRVNEMGDVLSTSRQARDIIDQLIGAYSRATIVVA